jgi:hypothetical protein
MTTRVSAVEARRTLGNLLNIVSLRREDVIIERSGKSIARLSSCSEASTTRGTGKIDLRKSRGLGRDMWRGTDSDAYIEKERDEWG